MLSGSVAMSIYVEPRATRDIDFIVNIQEKDILVMVDYFSKGYYCEIDSIKDAVARNGMFNIIDHASGFKADFIILKETEYRQTEFSRRQEADFFGMVIFVVSSEDLLLSKLLWIQHLQSELQKVDIQTLATLNDLDWNYINNWIKILKINTFGLI